MKKTKLFFALLSGHIQKIDKSPLLITSILFSIFFYDPAGSTLFWWLIKEDGIIEYLTAASFFASSILFGSKWKPKTPKKRAYNFLAVALSIGFCFISLEEISYGQRILNFSISAVEKSNSQGEFTFHNLNLVQPYLHIAISIVLLVFSILALQNSNHNTKLPLRKDLLYFGIPFVYFMFGTIISALPLNLIRAPLGNQEIFEFIFSIGVLKYSYQYTKKLR